MTMVDINGPPTPAAPVNPHADIERAASSAIGLPVRAASVADGIAHVLAPHHTTLDGKRAIVAAVGKVRPDLVCFVVLDEPTPES